MALPDTLTAERHRDLAGRIRHTRARRALLVLLAAVPVLALANFFGQRPSSQTVNTIEPSPESETSADGNLRFDLGKIDAGRSYLLFIQLQVNPPDVGRRS